MKPDCGGLDHGDSQKSHQQGKVEESHPKNARSDFWNMMLLYNRVQIPGICKDFFYHFVFFKIYKQGLPKRHSIDQNQWDTPTKVVGMLKS